MRSVGIWTLTVLSCIVVVLATVTLAAQQLLLNTDRWVAVVGPLASNATVQASVANTAAAVTLNALDLQNRVQALPAPVRNLAAPIESQIGSFVDDQALQLVQSPQFAEVWTNLNRAGHQSLVQVLRGQPLANGAVSVNNGEVLLNLMVLVPPVLTRVQQVIPEPIAARFPDIVNTLAPNAGTIAVAQASALASAQQLVQFVDRATLGLVVAAPLLILVTLIVSADRRVAVLRLGIGVAIGMLVAGVLLLVGQNSVIGSLEDRPIKGALEVAIYAGVASLAVVMLAVFLVAVVAAVAAYVLGRGTAHASAMDPAVAPAASG